MADLTINTSNLLQGSGAVIQTVVAGEAITAGAPVYQGADTKWYNAGAAGNSTQSGTNGLAIALASVFAVGQQLPIQQQGPITIGATLTRGKIYVVSNNAGKICLDTDLTTNHYVSILGVATNTTSFTMLGNGPYVSNTQI